MGLLYDTAGVKRPQNQNHTTVVAEPNTRNEHRVELLFPKAMLRGSLYCLTSTYSKFPGLAPVIIRVNDLMS